MRPAVLFVAEPYRPGKPYVRILRDSEGLAHADDTLFKQLPKDYALTGFRFTPRIEESDFVLVPQPIRRLDAKPATPYLEKIKRQAKAAGKGVVVFLSGDDSDGTHIDDVILFSTSMYQNERHANEILMIPFVEDFAEQIPFVARQKRTKPVISFCGYAGFPSLRPRVKYYLTNAYLDIASVITGNSQMRAHKRGIYFRRKSMQYLTGDPRFETVFIARNSFSGNTKLVVGDPKQIRQEYIENLRDSDFALAPKGDPNHSTRLYESLAMGRIPILIDTATVLPLEKLIDYNSFIVRVPFTDLKRIGDYVAKFYASCSEAEWEAKQRKAQEAFATYLRYDKFYNTVFPLLVSESSKVLGDR